MEKDALLHMIAWAMNKIQVTQKEALTILEDESLDETKKLALLQSESGPEIRLLNLFVLLKPALEVAKKEYSEQTHFFEWFDERWNFIMANKYIVSECGCKGCKKNSTQD